MSSSTKSSTNTRKMYIVLAASLCLTFLIGSLPPVGEITEIGMKIVGIFLGCILAWLFGYLGWGSLMGLLLLALYVPENTVNNVFSSAYGNTMFLMIFFCLIFCYGLQKMGLLPFLANFLLSRKFATKSPWTLAITFWITIIICAGLTSNTLAVTVFLYSVFFEVADKVGIKRRSTYCASVLIFMCTLGALAILLMPYSASLWTTIGLTQVIDPSLTPDIPKIMLTAWVLIFSSFIIIAVLFKILLKTNIIKVDFSLDNLENIIDYEALKITKQVKLGFFYIAILLVIMIGPSVLPAESTFVTFLNKFGMLGAFAFIDLLMCLTTAEGKLTLTLEEAMMKGIPWGVYFMISTAYLVASLVVAENTGVTATLLPIISNIVPTNNVYLTVLVFLGIILILTNCITNFVAMQLTIPIIAVILLRMGINPLIFAGLIGVLADHGNVMPSGSPIGAYMHGLPEWHTGAQVYLWASVGSLCAYLATALIALPFTLFIFQ